MNALTTTQRIEASYRSYLRTAFSPRRPIWRDAFEQALDTDIDLSRGPYIQATPPFVSGASIRALVDEGVLHRGFTRLPGKVFPIERGLYLHQEQAIRRSVAGRNLLVATGTGSGKTECVLIPAIHDLLTEADAGTLGDGVRVLLLYPMNALANDQLRRFRDWLRAFPEITFGRFVGDTKERERDAQELFRAIHQSAPPPNEMISRERMRETPPHILVTNYSMLEYLLLRPADTAFFDAPMGTHWRRIALDEAHVYDGADGAEVAMLLRRLRDRVVASRRGVLQVTATSATLGRGVEDHPELVRFGEDLFDETFEMDDVIGPSRLSLARRAGTTELPEPAVAELASLLRRAEETGEVATAEQVARVVRRHAPGHPAATAPAPLLAAALPSSDGREETAAARTGRLLHDGLADDARIVALQRALDEHGTLRIAEAAGIVLGDEARTAEIVDLVDLGVRARETPDASPLLPARYHHWLRGLEGAYVCLHPSHPAGAPQLMLTVAALCPGCEGVGVTSHTVELGVCRRCGADYAIGLGIIGGMLRRVPVGQAPTAYLLLDPAIEADDEDDLPDPAASPVATADAAYCPGCGLLMPDPVGPCECPSDPPARRTGQLVLVGGEEPRMSRCPACSGSSPGGNVVARFLTDSAAPAAIIATGLYQELPVASDPRMAERPGEGRKLLAFADSRQDAAHFAPYLERTYRRAVERSLLLGAIEAASAGEGLRPDDITPHLLDLALRHGLIEHRESAATQRRTVLTWIAAEILAMDRRQSLDGVGLVRIGPAMPPDVPESLAPLGLPEPVARDLAATLLDSLRIGGAVLLPPGLTRTDEVFAPRNQDVAMRGSASERDRQLLAWEPSRTNRRRELLTKVADAAGLTIDANAILRALWEEMTERGSPWEHLLPSEPDRRRGLVRRLASDGIEFLPAASAPTRVRCERCRSVWFVDLLGICPGYTCGGRVRPLADDEALGHYATLYRSLAPVPMRAREHTAQWASEKGADIQQRFLDGELNVLSCSTTFELGVDVGDVEAVLLRNVPPTAANYVQRAGRAGRRTSGAALVVTLAQRRNHDIAWFRDPRPMVTGVVNPPRIVTENPIIARRHAHSVALAAFLRREEPRTVAEFFEVVDGAGLTALDRFLAWLDSRPPILLAALERIVPPTTAAEIGLAEWRWVRDLMERSEEDPSAGWLGRARDEVRSEIAVMERLIRDAADRVQADPGDTRSGGLIKAISYQLKSVRDTRLIEFLARRNVLPKYGFPVDVVQLDLGRSGDQAADGIELDRDLRIAIAEYAPGSEVVAAGVVWRSTGLRKVPERGWEEKGWAVCGACGRYRESPAQDAPELCPCGSPDLRHRGTRVRPEFGFHGRRSSTVIGDEPILRRSAMRSWFTGYGESEEPVETQPAGIVPGSVRTLVSRQGRIVTINLGPGMRGFRLCSTCGHATPAPMPGARNGRATHDALWSGRPCEGGLRTVQLSTDFLTDIVEVRVARPWPEDALRSALYALLEGATGIGIKRRELDGTLHAYSPGSQSLILFDTVPGGAGHALRIAERFSQVVQDAISRVELCDCGIETSCYGCLRSYTNQLWHEELTRQGALSVLLPLQGRTLRLSEDRERYIAHLRTPPVPALDPGR